MDRYTILADRTLDILTEYWFKCGKPRNILFPSQVTGDYLDISAVNQVLKRSAERAGIPKHVTSHAFRHSFASHLLEAGCDIKYIQALLGHLDPKSTEIYLHVSNKTLLGIKSPDVYKRQGKRSMASCTIFSITIFICDVIGNVYRDGDINKLLDNLFPCRI